jgi:cytoskeletal protein CcmA (bactofilin family)
MWGKDKTMAIQTSNSTTLISKDSEIIGDIKFSGDLEIQGRVKGNVIASSDNGSSVRLVEGGCVEGEIHSPRVIINGEIKGDVHSAEHVELAAKARVEGNVHYNLIEMVKGAQINGSLLYAGAAKLSAATPIGQKSAAIAEVVD